LIYQDVNTDGFVNAPDIRIANHPASIPPTLTHIGLVLSDDTSVVIDGTVAKLNLPAEGADSLGSRIQTLHLPGFVTLTIDNLGGRQVELSVTDGTDTVTPVFRHSADLINRFLLTVTDPAGIKAIQVREISSIVDIDDPLVPEPIVGATLDVSNISTFTDQFDKVDDVDFDFVGAPTLQTFDVGFFFSDGFAQSVVAQNLPVKAEFFAKDSLGTPDADPDYLACTGECADLKTYDVLFNNNPGEGRKIKSGGGGGGGGEEPPPPPPPGTATIIQDAGVGIGVIDCILNLDGDGICDEHEVDGVPFLNLGKIDFYPLGPGTTAIGDPETFDHEPLSLPGGPTVGIIDIPVEIDYMKTATGLNECPTCTDGDHKPDPKALDDVVEMYEAAGIRLLINVDEAVEHKDLISMWQATHSPTDINDQSVTSGYNEITSIHFGTANIHPTITRPQINTITPVSPGNFLITITGLEVTTPCNPHTTITPNTSQLTIKSNVVIQIDQTRQTVTAPGPNGAVPLAPAVEFFYTAPVVLSIQKLGTLHTVNFEVTATAGFGFGNTCEPDVGGGGTPLVMTPPVTLGALTIPISISSTSASVLDKDGNAGNGVQSITVAPNPKIISEMQIAYAQSYRHFLWGHSFGGPGGLAEIRGNNAVVMTGVGFGATRADRTDADDFGTVDVTHDGGDRYVQSGTFGHELGHTVNFGHGGPLYLIGDPGQNILADVTENCKPNMDNIMTYTGQLPGLFLSLSTVTALGPTNGDVLSSSEWQLAYSDGTHGINPIEALFDPAHVDDLIVEAGLNPAVMADRDFMLAGLVETDLDEISPLPGTEITFVWGTPAVAGVSHRGAHATHKALSTDGFFDWNDSDRKAVGSETGITADINNLGIGGCLASDPLLSPEFFDYDFFFHIDPDFTQGVSGQFDGITIFNPDLNDEAVWEAILLGGVFDGLDEPTEDGLTVANAGSNVEIDVKISDDTDSDFNLNQIALANVFVTKEVRANNEIPGVSDGDGDPFTGDPTIEWIQIRDNDPGNPTPELMQWRSAPGSITGPDRLSLDFKLPKKGTEFGNTPATKFNVEGDWFIRVVISADPTSETDFFTCDTSDPTVNTDFDADGNGEFKACLAGILGNPTLNFLIDTVGDDPDELGTTLRSFETIYDDVDGSGDVSTGDIRIAHTDSDETIVASDDADEIEGASLVGFASTIKFVDSNATPLSYDAGEKIYDDVDTSGDVSTGDIRIANTGSDGTIVASGDADEIAGDSLVSLAGTTVKFVDSDSSGTFDTGERELATGKFLITKGSPKGGKDPPPGEQELPEMDNLIALLNEFIDNDPTVDAEFVKNNPGRNLRNTLNDAKQNIIDDDDAKACTLVKQFEEDLVAGLDKGRVSVPAKDALLTASAAVKTSIGCT